MTKIAAALAPIGVKPEVFVATANSFAVSSKIKQTAAMIPRLGVEGTPAVVVAGKYRVTTPAGKSYDYTIQTIDFLVRRELALLKPAVPVSAPAVPMPAPGAVPVPRR